MIMAPSWVQGLGCESRNFARSLPTPSCTILYPQQGYMVPNHAYSRSPSGQRKGLCIRGLRSARMRTSRTESNLERHSQKIPEAATCRSFSLYIYVYTYIYICFSLSLCVDTHRHSCQLSKLTYHVRRMTFSAVQAYSIRSRNLESFQFGNAFSVSVGL